MHYFEPLGKLYISDSTIYSGCLAVRTSSTNAQPSNPHLYVRGYMRGSYLLQGIDEVNYKEFFIALKKSTGTFHLCISSIGGDTSDMWAFVDTILTSKRKIVGTAIGVCHSAAPLILAACDVRRCTPNTQFMVHEDSIKIKATPSKARKFVERQQSEEDRWYVAMATLTDITIGQWRKLAEDETYFDASEALNLGLVDKVVSVRKGRPE